MADTNTFTTKDFAAGKTLFSQGEEGDSIYLIINGAVDISRKIDGQEEHVARVSSGDIIGEMAGLTDNPRCASAVAAVPTRVLIINDRALHLALMNNKLPILRPLASQLILRFKEAEQQADYYRRKFHRLEKEMTHLNQQLLQYELAEEN